MLSCYDFDTREPILMTFRRTVTEKVKNHWCTVLLKDKIVMINEAFNGIEQLLRWYDIPAILSIDFHFRFDKEQLNI